jgi:excisionase family DNA binding protein
MSKSGEASVRRCRESAAPATQSRNACRTFPSGTATATTLADSVLNHGKALKVAELAFVLAISIKTIYKMVEAGRVPYIRVFGSIRFDPATTAAWIQSKSLT